MDDSDANESSAGYFKGASFQLLAQLLALAAGLLLQSIAAHRLAAADYARFCLAHTFVLLGTQLLSGVFPRIFARHVSLNDLNLRVVWRAMFQWNLPMCAIFALLLWMIRGPLSMGLNDQEMAPLISWVALVIATQCGILEPSWQILNGLRKIGLQAVLVTIHGVLRLGCVYVALVVFRHEQAGWGMLGLLVASVISMVITLQVVFRMVRNAAAIELGTKLELKELWTWFRLVPFVDVMNYVLLALNLSAVKALVSNADAVASYAACTAIAQANIPICRALSRGFFPYVATASRNQGSEMGDLIRSFLRCVLIGLALQLAMMITVGDRLVLWFSGIIPYAPQMPTLLVLSTALLGIAYAQGELLVAAGALQGRFYSAVIYGAAGVSLNLLLPASYGIAGSVAAMCLSGILALLATLVIVRAIIGRLSILSTTVRCAASTMFAVLACHFLPQSPGALETGVTLAVATLAFLFGLILTREITPAELRYVLARCGIVRP